MKTLAALMILVVFGLAGCVLDGFNLSAAYQPLHPGANEPVASGSTWKMEPTDDVPVTIHMRVVRVAANVYAMEQFMDEGGGKAPALFVFTARFVALGNDWHALYWQQGLDKSQGYYLVRLRPEGSRSDLILLEPSAQAEEVIRIAQSTQGLLVKKQVAQIGLAIDTQNEAQLLRLFRTLTETPTIKTRRLAAVDGVPPAMAKKAYSGVGELFTRIDREDFSDPARGAIIAGYFQALHAEGNGWGSYALARLTHQGWGVRQDVRQAKDLARQAIARGVPQAANVLGIHAYHGMEEPKDLARAVKYFKQAAEAGEPRAYLSLGVAYLEGQGTAKNDVQAKFWLEKAESKNVPTAGRRLAEALLREKNHQSDVLAAELVDKAIAEGDVDAYDLRGWMHEHGRGGPLDQASATQAYLTGAERGHSYAQWKAGDRLIRGIGAEADRSTGRKWIEAAAKSGVAEAEQALKQMGAFDLASKIADEEILRLSKAMRATIVETRAKFKNTTEFKRLAILREIREKILSGRERGALGAREHQGDLVKAYAGILKLESLSRDFFGLRLPDGRIAALTLHGQYVALASDSKKELDAGTLPRVGDQAIDRANESVLVEYEQSWSEVPEERPEVVASLAELNRLIGSYQCERKFLASTTYWRNPTKHPAVVLDVSGVIRHREQASTNLDERWEDADQYAPLNRLSRISSGSMGSGCGYVLLHCEQGQACAVKTNKGSQVQVDTSVSIHLQGLEQAQRAAQILQRMIGGR